MDHKKNKAISLLLSLVADFQTVKQALANISMLVHLKSNGMLSLVLVVLQQADQEILQPLAPYSV